MRDNQKNSGKFADPMGEILGPIGLAALLGISPSTIPSLRSRDPHKLPPPYLTRPLRWRREGVLRWMESREQAELSRLEHCQLLRPHRA